MTKASQSLKANYQEALRALRTSTSCVPIPNRRPYQVELAIGELIQLAINLQAAKSRDPSRSPPVELKILTGNCANRFYGCTANLPLFEEFLRLGGRVRVLVWNEWFNPEDRRLLSLLRKLDSAKAQIRFSYEKKFDGDDVLHFLLIDNVAYRYETTRHDDNIIEGEDMEPEIPAIICFNDPTGAEVLSQNFEILWLHAETRDTDFAASPVAIQPSHK
ncbi:MAG: hypothetical protein K8T25_09605 [Planctomycetia bacterium]|nr:hypothetical protein [Planctomycetia bacterium]